MVKRLRLPMLILANMVFATSVTFGFPCYYCDVYYDECVDEQDWCQAQCWSDYHDALMDCETIYNPETQYTQYYECQQEAEWDYNHCYDQCGWEFDACLEKPGGWYWCMGNCGYGS